MTTSLAEALGDAARRLRQAGVEAPAREARLLAGAVLCGGSAALIAHPERPVDAEEKARLDRAIARRAAREPLSHILGRREFWSLPFAVSGHVLDPRPDSETLIAAALDAVADRAAALRLLDLGTGSGCLLLALLSELPAATGIGVDLAPAALRIARANARRLGLAARATFRRGDWGEGLAGRFDLILCNPPYVPSAAIAGLAPEVAHYEPRLSLDGGPDGLACYRRLAPQLDRLLSPGGRVLLEIGHDQAAAVGAILGAAGLGRASLRRDLANRPRCLVLAAAGPPQRREKTIWKAGRTRLG